MEEISHRSVAQSNSSISRPTRGIGSWRWYAKFWLDPIACITTVYRRFGPLVVLAAPALFRRAERINVLALGPRYNRLVFGQPEKFRAGGFVLYGPRNSALGRLRRGLAGSNGERYRRQRQIIMPPFQRRAVEGYVVDMNAIIDDFLNGWPIDQPVDMYQLMRRLSLCLSSHLLFGNDDLERSMSLSHMVESFLGLSASAAAGAFPVNVPGLPYHRLFKRAEVLERAIGEMIELKRRRDNRGQDVLSIMVRACSGDELAFSETELPGHTLFMFAASYETAANAMGWTLFLLAQHPKVALGLMDELEGASLSDPPTLDELDALPLLNAVVSESMRILPPVPLTLRTATTSADLDGLKVQRGDRIVLSHYMTHHMAEIYPEPNRFDPQRWFNFKPDPYAYLPFSAGPRLCVGYHFAMAEIRLALVKIMQRFRLSVVPGSRIDRKVRVTMNPAFGLPMTIHRQDRAFQTAPVRGQIHEMVDLPAPTV
jgi:cytochrome P450